MRSDARTPLRYLRGGQLPRVRRGNDGRPVVLPGSPVLCGLPGLRLRPVVRPLRQPGPSRALLRRHGRPRLLGVADGDRAQYALISYGRAGETWLSGPAKNSRASWAPP